MKFTTNIISLILLLLASSFATAQDLTVKGNVLDGNSDNAPMIYASVRVKGLDISTETDIDGNYELSLLEGNYVLIVEFIGYDLALEYVRVEKEKILLDPIVLRAKKPNYDFAEVEE